jgi:spore germination protein GerM
MMQIMRNAVMEWSEKNINSNCLKHHKSTIQLTKNAVENEQKKKATTRSYYLKVHKFMASGRQRHIIRKYEEENTFNISLIALAKEGLTSAGCKAPLA